MSFELMFFNQNSNLTPYYKFTKYLETLSRETDTQWMYENHKTGVCFIMSYGVETQEFLDSHINLDGYTRTNFSFVLNYNRPEFFAEESFEYINKFCQSFDLLIIDAQELESNRRIAPQRFDLDKVKRNWIAGNKLSRRIFNAQSSTSPYLDKEKSRYWWNHQYHLESYRSILGEDIYIPDILLYTNKKENVVETSIVWTDAIPFVFPECDWVIIVRREKKGLFGLKNEYVPKGWIQARRIKEMLLPFLQEIKIENKNYQTLTPEIVPSIRDLFAKIEAVPIPEYFKSIPPDSIVDELSEK